jgi:transcriptional regulator of acetoin/glycerol metabolism
VSDLPSALRNFALCHGDTANFGEGIASLAEVERRHVLRAMDHTKGDVSAAAMMLGIGRNTLYRKLKRYGSDQVESGQTETRTEQSKTSRGAAR